MEKIKNVIQEKIRVGSLFLLGAIVLRGPFLVMMRLLPRYFDYIFFVYPGKESEIGGYVPQFIAHTAWCRTQIFFGGIITAPRDKKAGRGILIGAPSTVRSMVRSEDECRLLEKKIRNIANHLSVRKIAVAGRAPSIFMRHGISMEDPFVPGEKGMVFCTLEMLRFVAKKHNLSLQTSKIAVFGAGRVGRSIVDHLSAEHCNVTSINAQSIFDHEEKKLPTDVNEILKEMDVVIVISSKGSDFHPYMKHLKSGAIIISETHPAIQRPFKQGSLYRAGLSLDGLRFFPALETYSATSIPGCVIEAIVCAQYGDIADQSIFNQRAREIGFCACNVI